jgi:hypothetical protein
MSGMSEENRGEVLKGRWSEPVVYEVCPRTRGVIRNTDPPGMNDAECLSMGEGQLFGFAFSLIAFGLGVG